jgi:hypothetical protein
MKYCKELSKKGISYIQSNEGSLTGLATPCIGTAFVKHVIEETIEGRKREKEGQSS